MTNSRVKSEPLSETTKTALRELWIKETYNREKYDKANKYTDKGIMCEADAMELIKTVTGVSYFKNKTTFENEFITGTPDIVDGKQIKDTKCSWDIWTFNGATEKSAYKDYYYQQLGYMWLTGGETAELMYCLVNTPEPIMNDELYRLSFRFPEINGSDESKIAPFKRNFIFDDIPAPERLKVFPLAYSADDVEELKDKIFHARDYLAALSL